MCMDKEHCRNITLPCPYSRAQAASKGAEGSLAHGSWGLPLAK